MPISVENNWLKAVVKNKYVAVVDLSKVQSTCAELLRIRKHIVKLQQELTKLKTENSS